MSAVLENSGSTARDFCMLERNLLSHYKLAILISLVSSSIILRVRLSTSDGSSSDAGLSSGRGIWPIGSVQLAVAILTIGAGIWEYQSSYVDMRNSRAFLFVTKPHFCLMTIIAGVVLTTCILLLADENII